MISGPCSVSVTRSCRLEAVHELVVSRGAPSPVSTPRSALRPGCTRLLPGSQHRRHSRPTPGGWTCRRATSSDPTVRSTCSGTKVERFYAFGPLPGIPVMAVLVSHEGICTLGFTVDPAAVTDLAGALMDCTRTSVRRPGRRRRGPDQPDMTHQAHLAGHEVTSSVSRPGSHETRQRVAHLSASRDAHTSRQDEPRAPRLAAGCDPSWWRLKATPGTDE